MKEFNAVLNEASRLAQMVPVEIKELWAQAIGAGEGAMIVEIGTGQGGSALVLASGDGNVFTIDTEESPDVPEGNFTKIIGESLKIAATWKEPIDLLFIDGNHFYEFIREDIKAWLPHVKQKGKVIFHDYDSHIGVTLAVHRAIEEKLLEPIKKSGSILVTIKS